MVQVIKLHFSKEGMGKQQCNGVVSGSLQQGGLGDNRLYGQLFKPLESLVEVVQ